MQQQMRIMPRCQLTYVAESHTYAQILFLCVSAVRNFGMGDTKIQMESKSTKHQKSEFTMRVSKHEATVRFDVFLLLFRRWWSSLLVAVHPVASP